MSAETLRRAAEQMRQDWDIFTTADRVFYRAVAEWLDDAAAFAACDGCSSPEERCLRAQAKGAIACCPDCRHPSHNALAVARAYLECFEESNA